MVAASAIGIFFIPAIFYLVEKWSGAVKEQREHKGAAPGSLPQRPVPAEGN